MIPGFDLIQFAQTTGSITAIIVVAIIIFAENGLLIGFFLPGDSILFTVGFLISGTKNFSLDINLLVAILILFVAATVGSSVGYLFGRKIGPGLFNRPNSRLFKQENVKKAQDFYGKHGGKTIIIARFIPIVRTFVPLIAGITRMKYKTFMVFNLIGGAVWIGGVVYLGFFLGEQLTRAGLDIDSVLLPIVALILVVSILPGIYHLLKDKKQRQAIWNSTKIELKKVFKIKIK
jgi:membrane-associated protein